MTIECPIWASTESGPSGVDEHKMLAVASKHHTICGIELPDIDGRGPLQ